MWAPYKSLRETRKTWEKHGNKNYFETKCKYLNRWLLIIWMNLQLLKHIMDFILMDSSLFYELSANKIYSNDLLRESKSMLICRIGTLENASGTLPAQQRKATVSSVSLWCCGARILKTLNECTLLNILHIHPSGDCQNED